MKATPHIHAAVPLPGEVREHLAAVNETGMLGNQSPEGRGIGSEPAEVLRGDADDRRGSAVQTDPGSDYTTIRAEVAHPEAMTQDHDGVRRWRLVAEGKEAARSGSGAQFREEVAGHEIGSEGRFLARKGETRRRECQDSAERPRILPIERDRGIRHVGPESTRALPLKAQQTLRITNGQRTERDHVEG